MIRDSHLLIPTLSTKELLLIPNHRATNKQVTLIPYCLTSVHNAGKMNIVLDTLSRATPYISKQSKVGSTMAGKGQE